MVQHCQDLFVTQAMIQSQPITELFFLMMHSEHTGAGGAGPGYQNVFGRYLNI